MNRRSLCKAGLPLAAILILAAGCAEHSPTAVELDPASLSANRGATVVKGSGPAIVSHQHEAGSYSAMITHRGGTLDFGIGSITFPAGALDGPTRITAVTDGGSLAVTFGPSGLQFPATHRPVLSFGVPANLQNSALSIIYMDTAGKLLENLGGFAADLGTFRVELSHFSAYALMQS